MFKEPALIETKVFARLPDHLHVRDRKSEWLEARPFGRYTSFLEGPSFDRHGNLYCVDIPFGRVLRVSSAAEFSVVAQYEGEPNGLKIHKDGRIFIADQRHGIMLLDPQTSEINPFFVRFDNEPLHGPNDLVFKSNGDMYFTDQGNSDLRHPTGRVIRISAAGEAEIVVDDIPSPNGLVFNADESILYVAVTRGNAIWRVPLDRSGKVGKVGIFIQLSGGSGPDGLAMDEAGNLLVVHSGLGCVWVFSPRGEPLYRINACTGASTTTNLAYGGTDRKTLYITEAVTGSILSAHMDVPGVQMYSHA